jgi:hypothetical protein
VPLYWVRLVGGTLFFLGLPLLVYNVWRTMRSAPAGFREEAEVHAPRLVADLAAPGATTAPNTYDHAFYRAQHTLRHGFHRWIEGNIVVMTVLTALALSVGSLIEALPMFFDPGNVKTIASVRPYTPLELLGRDIYLREGCYNCHSQMVRPFRYETERYGEYSKAGEFVYDHPFQWGSKRTGPDLHRVGGKYPSLARAASGCVDDAGVGHAALPHLLTADRRGRVGARCARGAVGTLHRRRHRDGAGLDDLAREIAAEVELAGPGGPAGDRGADGACSASEPTSVEEVAPQAPSPSPAPPLPLRPGGTRRVAG